MLDLPLSVRAALWLTAALAGRTDPSTAHRAIRRGVTDSAGTQPGPGSWPADGERVVLPALPRPGAPAGMPPAPAAALAAAVAAGECLVAATTGGLLVPEVTPFGPAGDRGLLVDWRVHPADPVPPHRLEAIDAADLARRLADAVRAATGRLEAAGGIPWRAPGPARGDGGSAVLPTGLPARPLHLLLRAADLRSVARAGLEHEEQGAALDAGTSVARAAALRTLLGTVDDVLADTTAVLALALAHPRG